MNKNLLLLSAIITLLLFSTRGAWAQKFTYTHLSQTLNYEIVDSDVQVISNRNISGSVTIPETVTYEDNTYNVRGIGNSAFRSCANLKTITLQGDTPPSLSDNVFEAAPLARIDVPSASTLTYKTHDDWSVFADLIGVIYSCNRNKR